MKRLIIGSSIIIPTIVFCGKLLLSEAVEYSLKELKNKTIEIIKHEDTFFDDNGNQTKAIEIYPDAIYTSIPNQGYYIDTIIEGNNKLITQFYNYQFISYFVH